MPLTLNFGSPFAIRDLTSNFGRAIRDREVDSRFASAGTVVCVFGIPQVGVYRMGDTHPGNYSPNGVHRYGGHTSREMHWHPTQECHFCGAKRRKSCILSGMPMHFPGCVSPIAVNPIWGIIPWMCVPHTVDPHLRYSDQWPL